MSRNVFGNWGISLDPGAFARSLAAWGTLRAAGWEPPYSQSMLNSELIRLVHQDEPGRLIPWRLTNEDLEEINRTLPPFDLADAWDRVAGESFQTSPSFSMTGVRLQIQHSPLTDPILPWLLHLFSHPESRVFSSFIEEPEAIPDGSWNWPLEIGFFSDTASQRLRKARPVSRYSLNLARHFTIPDEMERCDILVLPEWMHEASRQLLAAPHHIRAQFLLLLGGVDLPWDEGRHLVPLLLRRTHAAGIAITPIPTEKRASFLIHLIEEFSHNLTLDLVLNVILNNLFEPTDRPDLMIFTTQEFLLLSRLDATAQYLIENVEDLPADSPLDLSELSTIHLNLRGWFDRSRVQALSGIAPLLEGERRQQTWEQALQAVLAIHDEYARAQELSDLAPHLGEGLMQQALQAALKIRAEYALALALSGIAPLLNDELLEQALQAALKIQDESSRVLALSHIAQAFKGKQKRQLGKLALQAALKIRVDYSRIQALSEVAPLLQRAQRQRVLEQALQAALNIEDVYLRAQALIRIAPLLEGERKQQVLQQALQSALAISGEYTQAQVLSDLAPQLKNEPLEQVRQAAIHLTDPYARALALSGIAPLLEGEQTEQVLEQAQQAALKVGWAYGQAQALGRIAPLLEGDQRTQVLEQTLQAALKIEESFGQAETLSGIAPLLEGEQRRQVLGQAFQAALAIKDDSARTRALISLANHLQGELQEQALDAALSGLAHMYPHELAAELETRSIDYTFSAESAEASGWAALSADLESAGAKGVIPERQARYIQAKVYEPVPGNRQVSFNQPLWADRDYTVSVRVGPPDSDWLGPPPEFEFPNEKLPKSRRFHRLQVVFIEPFHAPEPQIQTITLPSRGSSSIAEFYLHTRSDRSPFEARVVMLFENRILQTALLRSQVLTTDRPDLQEVEAGLNLTIEAVVRNNLTDLEKDSVFGASIVLNHNPFGEFSMQAFSREKATVISLGDTKPLIDQIKNDLGSIYRNPANFEDGLMSESTQKLLRNLALSGSQLYDSLLKFQYLTDHPLLKESRLQVVTTNIATFLPLEYIYDRSAPEFNAPLCENAAEALRSGKCECQLEDESAAVCPLGFWGMRKVIERFASERPEGAQRLAGGNFGLSAGINGKNAELAPFRSVIYAASKIVDEDIDHPNQIQAVLDVLQTVSRNKTIQVNDWDKWRLEVQAELPSLLVLLPHNKVNPERLTIHGLEIGKDQTRWYPHLRIEDMRRPDSSERPIVLLLGCETMSTDIPYESFVAKFLSLGAAIVLGTTTSVLGYHAAPVACKICEILQKIASEGTHSFGEMMLNLRRQAMLAGYPMVLTLFAYGDAGWKLIPVQD